ncbi:MAG: hypothetical protein IKK79_03660 [Spirochaetaceae bacterium]|nr:hypothetical protein [Spirochaetaceae bacterium]
MFRKLVFLSFFHIFGVLAFSQDGEDLRGLTVPQEASFTYISQYERDTGFFSSSLTGLDLIKVGLDFSSCPAETEEGQVVLSQYNDLVREVQSKQYQRMSLAERGEAVLRLMYRDILKKYVLKESSITAMFQKGQYNCVSATLLYVALAKEAGLETTIYKTTDHSFCAIKTEDRLIEVETTNPYGFDPGTKKALPAQKKGATSWAVIPQRYYRNKITISDRVLASLVGGNISTLAMKDNDYGLAVPLSIARYEFTRKEDSTGAQQVKDEFDIVLTNYVYHLQDVGRHVAALEWMRSATEEWGVSTTWQKCIDVVVHNSVVFYLNQSKVEQAQEVYDGWSQQLTERTQEEVAFNLFVGTMDAGIKDVEPAKALSFLRTMEQHPVASTIKGAAKLKENREYVWQSQVKVLVDQQQFLEAAAVARQGVQALGTSRVLSNLEKQCLNNHAVTVHNKYADLFNQKKYQEALEVVQQGLMEVPGNRTLQADLNKVQRALKN